MASTHTPNAGTASSRRTRAATGACLLANGLSIFRMHGGKLGAEEGEPDNAIADKIQYAVTHFQFICIIRGTRFLWVRAPHDLLSPFHSILVLTMYLLQTTDTEMLTAGGEV